MTYLKQFQLAEDGSFIRRVQQALIETAIAAVAENPATVNHVNRLAYAIEVFKSPLDKAKLMAYGVATTASINDQTSTEADVKSAVTALYDSYAAR